MVRVYRFRGFDVGAGAAVISSRLGTKEAIEGSPELELLQEPYWVVDSSILDGDGMTRRLNGGLIAYGALDDHGNAYVVLEQVVDDPLLTREAFRLLNSATLIHAEQFATEYNRLGILQAVDGPPLVGRAVPRLHTPLND